MLAGATSRAADVGSCDPQGREAAPQRVSAEYALVYGKAAIESSRGDSFLAGSRV